MTTARHAGDIDIDFADRTKALSVLDHTPASMIRNNKIDRHNTGVYFHLVPTDPMTGFASMHYETAEQRGWYKFDLLNVGVYEKIKSENHLLELMSAELDWTLLEHHEFTSQLIHLGNHHKLVSDLKPASIMEIAMILALIRPGKKHLVDRCKREGFSSIAGDIWTETNDGSYAFKKAHAFSYAMLVKVHANLLVENALTFHAD
jgi:DNA polymerase III alpha subunit